MGPRVQVLASRVGDGAIGRLSYTAQVVDDEVGEDIEPLWKCDHRHDDPQTAYACAADWLANSGGGLSPKGGSPRQRSQASVSRRRGSRSVA
jgi:hypothetical protein